MKSTFKVLFYLKKDKISKDGKVPVMGRITVNGTQAGFSCKLNIDPALWDGENQLSEIATKYAFARNSPDA